MRDRSVRAHPVAPHRERTQGRRADGILTGTRDLRREKLVRPGVRIAEVGKLVQKVGVWFESAGRDVALREE